VQLYGQLHLQVELWPEAHSIHKARGTFLIQKGRTIDPDGLNIREDTLIISCFYVFLIVLFHFTICLSFIYTVIHLNVFQALQKYAATYKHVPM